MKRLVPIVLIAGVVASCGSDDAQTATDAAPSTSLTITLDSTEGGDPTEWTLSCPPDAGDTHPDPEAACANLDEVDAAVFEPVPPEQACTMIYGGPETAAVSGTLDGEQITAEFSLENGCEIARWEDLAGVLGEPGGITR